MTQSELPHPGWPKHPDYPEMPDDPGNHGWMMCGWCARFFPPDSVDWNAHVPVCPVRGPWEPGSAQ